MDSLCPGIKVNNLNMCHSIYLFSLWFLFCFGLVFCLAYKILHVNIVKTNEREGMFEGADEQQGYMRSIICCTIAAEKEWAGLERQAHREIRKCVFVSFVTGGRLKG